MPTKSSYIMAIRIAKLLISIFVCATDYLRKSICEIFNRKIDSICVVLYYHGVTKEQSISFTRQMDMILRWSNPVSADIKRPLQSGLRYVAVTFDDAFSCLIENAVPALIRRNIPFTIFVPTGLIGRRPEWMINGKKQSDIATVMNESQLKELKRNKIASIGSHCVTHSNLMFLEDAKAKNEIFKSKSDLENIIDQEVDLLSFPFGAHTNRHVEFARTAGYKNVFTIEPTCLFSDKSEYIIGRVNVNPTDWNFEFLLKLMGAYRWLPLAFSLKDRISILLSYKSKKRTQALKSCL